MESKYLETCIRGWHSGKKKRSVCVVVFLETNSLSLYFSKATLCDKLKTNKQSWPFTTKHLRSGVQSANVTAEKSKFYCSSPRTVDILWKLCQQDLPKNWSNGAKKKRNHGYTLYIFTIIVSVWSILNRFRFLLLELEELWLIRFLLYKY